MAIGDQVNGKRVAYSARQARMLTALRYGHTIHPAHGIYYDPALTGRLPDRDEEAEHQHAAHPRRTEAAFRRFVERCRAAGINITVTPTGHYGQRTAE